MGVRDQARQGVGAGWPPREAMTGQDSFVLVSEGTSGGCGALRAPSTASRSSAMGPGAMRYEPLAGQHEQPDGEAAFAYVHDDELEQAQTAATTTAATSGGSAGGRAHRP